VRKGSRQSSACVRAVRRGVQVAMYHMSIGVGISEVTQQLCRKGVERV